MKKHLLKILIILLLPISCGSEEVNFKNQTFDYHPPSAIGLTM